MLLYLAPVHTFLFFVHVICFGYAVTVYKDTSFVCLSRQYKSSLDLCTVDKIQCNI